MTYQQVTLATLRTRLFERVQASAHWVDAEALIALNDTLKFWNLLTGRWRRQVSVTFSPGSTPYLPLPGTLTWPMRVEHSAGTPITKTSITALDRALPGWEAQTTSSSGVPATVQFWAPRSLRLIALWPRPAVATPRGVDGISDTPELAADGDFIDLDEGLHNTFLDYAAHLLTWKDGGQAFLATASALQRFVIAAAAENQQIRSSSLYRAAAMQDTDPKLRARRRAGTEDQRIAQAASGGSA